MKARSAIVYVHDMPAAVLTKHAQPGAHRYELRYLPEYLHREQPERICYHMPPRPEPYYAEHLFPFFESLLPEGDNLEHICRVLKLDEDDRFGQLLTLACHDTIGCVTVREKGEA